MGNNPELKDKVAHQLSTYVDHIDENKLNNNLSNLRVLCNSCNVTRPKKNYFKGGKYEGIEFNGETKTAEEWSRSDGVFVRGSTIKRRLKSGLSVYGSLFMDKITHKNIKL